ncbi:MAG: NADH-quinone oxidoreductase subunit J [Cytophagales bacterium]|nr:MAG: NADH-quinone oxidoreductase subunit J [Cytophagales bacterium]
MTFFFYLFATLTLLMTLLLLLSKKLIHLAFSFLGVLLGIAALFVLAGADFLAVAQILVYAGGVLVLIIIGIMLTQTAPKENGQNITSHSNIISAVLVLVLFSMLVYAFISQPFEQQTWIQNAQIQQKTLQTSTLPSTGILLMTQYLLPFELTAILLLVAIAGAITLLQYKNKSRIL